MKIESFAVTKKVTTEYGPEIVKVFDEISTIAQIVGGDFGMSVKIGEAGRGSFYNPDEVSITIDPQHLEQNPNEAKFTVAHEGGHRAITRSPIQLGVSKEIVNQLYSKPGFAFIQNAIEDPADNDWFSKKFPGLKEYVKETYDNQFHNEDVTLSTPEVMDYAQKLGFMPKFAKFGSEVIRHWHQGRYAHGLDDQVHEALKKTEPFVKQSISEIPKATLTESEVVQKAQIRFQLNTEKVWPAVEDLMEEDIKNADRNEAMKDIQKKTEQKAGKSNKPEQNAEKNKAQNQQEQNKQNQEGEQGEQDGGQESSQSDNVENGSQDGKSKEGKSQLPKEMKDAGFTEEDLEKIANSMSKSNKGGTENKTDKSEDVNKRLKEQEEALKELSEKLDKYIENLPEDEKKKLKEKALENLENLEDALNKQMESKLNKEKAENHKDKREEKNKKQREAVKQDEIQKQKIDQEKKLEKVRKSLMTPYERYRSEVSGQIENLYRRLKGVLKPEDFGKEESGFSSGQTLDLTRVMQSDYDFNQKTKLWIREEQPEFRDYRFMNLIDMSSSMSDEPIKEVFKGFVVVGEALDRLEDFNSEKIKVHQAIKGFHDKVFDYKGFNKRFSEQLEKNLATIVDNTDGGTDTYKGTIDALEDMTKDLGKTGNFLLTYTDGAPNRESGERLKKLLKADKEERRKKKIRVGLVWLNNATDKELKEMINEYGYDFGLVLETNKKKGGKDFSEKLGDVIEDIIENPQKY